MMQVTSDVFPGSYQIDGNKPLSWDWNVRACADSTSFKCTMFFRGTEKTKEQAEAKMNVAMMLVNAIADDVEQQLVIFGGG